ncbi:MAG: DNA polymerase III subunit alpha [Candidatus Hodgkinia cicadicola]
MSKRAFVNLKVHSTYSILESALSIDKITELALKHSQLGVGLTDSNLHGALEFCVKCKRAGVQPIIGLKLLIDDQQVLFNKCEPLVATFIVCTERGYINLLKLLRASTQALEYRVITLTQLEAHSEGLIMMLGEPGGIAWEVYKQFGREAAFLRFELLRQIVNNRLCFELQRKTFVNQQFEAMIMAYANINGLITVATNETFFEAPEDYEVYKALRVVARAPIANISNQSYFKSYADMLTRYSDVPNTLRNCALICEMCKFSLDKTTLTLPTFLNNRSHESSALYMRLIASLERLFYTIGKTNKRLYYKRLLWELQVVLHTRYTGYFLIVMDFVTWAKANNIMVGPGRGSAAGSLLAYCAGITNVDPLRYGLLFERFLNPTRTNPPDIDVDFCHTARDDLIKYIKARYSIHNIAQISTFGILQLKGAIKDAGRCVQLQYSLVNAICAALPPSAGTSINKSALLACCAKMLIPQQVAFKLITITTRLVGVCRHVGTHAAGLVISSSSPIEHVPVVWDNENRINVTQYSMSWVDCAGLAKFDLLGLKTLTIVSGILELLASYRIEPNIDFKDEKTYKFICKGALLSTFQLESEGITKHVKHLVPSNLNDLAALIALYRPGPIAQIKLYSDIKHNRRIRTKTHSAIDSALDDTYGIIIYQEQVMLIAKAISGYSLAEADELRKAMAKKNKANMLAHAERFVNGAVAKGNNKQFAISMFDTLTRFADYGFNRSHAVAYAMLAYITAYLKCNFMLEYYAVCLTVEANESNEITDLYYEALAFGVEFAQPSVQAPIVEFRVVSGVIQFPLTSIKFISSSVVSSIAISKANKPFASLTDFCYKCDSKLITERVLKALVLGGALDCFGLSRAKLISNLNQLLYSIALKVNISICFENQSACAPTLELLYKEYCLTSCYTSENPIDRFAHMRQHSSELAIVVSQSKTTLTLILQTKRLEVAADIDQPLQLGQVYACEICYNRSKPRCKRLHLVRSA